MQEEGYTVTGGIRPQDARALARYVSTGTDDTEHAMRFDEAAIRAYIQEVGGGHADDAYTTAMLKRAFAEHVRLRRGVEYAHGLTRAYLTGGDTTADEPQHVWPFDGVQLRSDPGARRHHCEWAEGATGTVIRSAARGDWTVRLDGTGASYEVDVPGTAVHLLTARGYSAGDVAIAARVIGTDRTATGASESTHT